MSDLILSLAQIGAIQFGRFECQDNPGTFAPLALNLRYIPSYPAILKALAAEIASLVKVANSNCTHILAMPGVVPLGTAVSLLTEMPLVYPTSPDSAVMDGTYDVNVQTVLLTDVLANGKSEASLAKRVKGLGLEVKIVVCVLDLGISGPSINECPVHSWRDFSEVLPQLPELTATMRRAVEIWLGEQSTLQSQDSQRGIAD